MATTLGFDPYKNWKMPSPEYNPNPKATMQNTGGWVPPSPEYNPNTPAPGGPTDPQARSRLGLTAEEINQGIDNLGFGQAPTPVQAPTINTGGVTMPTAGQATSGTATAGTATASAVAPPPTIRAQQITAEQGGFDDFDALERSIFESLNAPTQRQLDIEKGEDISAQQARLAQAGLASSGTGQGALMRTESQYAERSMAVSQQAATQAAVQRYGLEFTQEMENARLRQEANMFNSQLDLTAQVENARNILTANVTTAQLATQTSIANATNQTQASIASAQFATQASIANAANQTQASIAGSQIGAQLAIDQARLEMDALELNVEQLESARNDFLNLVGINTQDLWKLDEFQLDELSILFDAYLKQLAIIASAGGVSSGKGDQASGSTGIDIDVFGGSNPQKTRV